ncbi:MAG: response regulator, partial [Pseudomonadota bacterium]
MIDDDAKLAGLLGSYFERFSMSLISALKPDAGMRALRSEKPDLVMLDIMLPDGDGRTFLVKQRAQHDDRGLHV